LSAGLEGFFNVLDMYTAEVENILLKTLERIRPFIGNTPLWPVSLVANRGTRVFAKLEWYQLGGSVKSRAVYHIIRAAVQDGKLRKSISLLDATSGNTGIAMAQIGAALRIPVTLVLPENASPERKSILKGLGAEIIYTSKFGTTDEAQEMALSMSLNKPGKYFYADQYSNENNWKAHVETTAQEIIKQTNGEITHFIAGLGTTGTFIGTTIGLKSYNKNIRCIALQPDSALHGLEGWKHLDTAKIPSIYREDLADEVRIVETSDAYRLVKQIAIEEGLLISPSSAANLLGAIQLSDEIEEGVIVTVCPDDISKYQEVLQQINTV
jgi:cysteine synthase B